MSHQWYTYTVLTSWQAEGPCSNPPCVEGVALHVTLVYGGNAIALRKVYDGFAKRCRRRRH